MPNALSEPVQELAALAILDCELHKPTNEVVARLSVYSTHNDMTIAQIRASAALISDSAYLREDPNASEGSRFAGRVTQLQARIAARDAILQLLRQGK